MGEGLDWWNRACGVLWYNRAGKGAGASIRADKDLLCSSYNGTQDDLKHLGAIAVYMLVGVAGILYKLVNSSDLETFLGGLADVGGAVFIVGLVVEGGVLIMVFALGRLSAERRRGREEGREEGRKDMVRAMREIGRPETEIQQALDRFDNRINGERER